jgi:hypothetical protein
VCGHGIRHIDSEVCGIAAFSASSSLFYAFYVGYGTFIGVDIHGSGYACTFTYISFKGLRGKATFMDIDMGLHRDIFQERGHGNRQVKHQTQLA